MRWNDAVEATVGMSQAEIARAADEAAKRAILCGRTVVARDDILTAIAERNESARS
jgi:histone H3/H4